MENLLDFAGVNIRKVRMEVSLVHSVHDSLHMQHVCVSLQHISFTDIADVRSLRRLYLSVSTTT